MRRFLLLGLVSFSGIGLLLCLSWGSWFAALGYLCAIVAGASALERAEVRP